MILSQSLLFCSSPARPAHTKCAIIDFFCCREIQCKAGKLLQKLEKSGQLDPKLKQCISNASSLDELESLAAPFKSASKQSLAAKAKSFQGHPTSIFKKVHKKGRAAADTNTYIFFLMLQA